MALLRTSLILVAVCVFAAEARLHYRGSLAQFYQHSFQAPDVANGEIPTAGEAVGDQTGVDVPNPHQYTGAIIGGGVAGTLVTIAVFVVASYYVYIWNKELVDAGKTTTCGWKSVLCCLCCTPISCCFQIDEGEPAKK